VRRQAAVCGAFGDLRSAQVGPLQEVACLGPVHVLQWPELATSPPRCGEAHAIRYVALKRQPREGLPRRQSTDLRGY